MNTLMIILGTLGSVFAAVFTVLSLINYRKPRKITVLSTFLSGLISTLSLAVMTFLGGMSLNLELGLPLFMIGVLLGFLRGITVKLRWENGLVIGRNSWLFLILWGLSLALSQLLGMLGSPLLASLGLIPVFFTTGLQGGFYGILFLRRLIMGRKGKDRKGLQIMVGIALGLTLLLLTGIIYLEAIPVVTDSFLEIGSVSASSSKNNNYSSVEQQPTKTATSPTPTPGLLPSNGKMVINCDDAVQDAINRDLEIYHGDEEGTLDDLYESYQIHMDMQVDLTNRIFSLNFEKHADELFTLYNAETGEQDYHHQTTDTIRTSQGVVLDDGWITGTSFIDHNMVSIVFSDKSKGSNDFYGYISDDLTTIVHCPLPVTDAFINQDDYQVDFEDLVKAGKERLVPDWWNPGWCFICSIEEIQP